MEEVRRGRGRDLEGLKGGGRERATEERGEVE